MEIHIARVSIAAWPASFEQVLPSGSSKITCPSRISTTDATSILNVIRRATGTRQSAAEPADARSGSAALENRLSASLARIAKLNRRLSSLPLHADFPLQPERFLSLAGHSSVMTLRGLTPSAGPR